MLDYRTSELYRQLVRQGLAKPPAGTGDEAIKAGEHIAVSRPELRQREEKTADLKLIWNNPNMSKATGRNTSRVVLEIVGA